MSRHWLSWVVLLLLVAVLSLSTLPRVAPALALDDARVLGKQIALAVALTAGGAAALLAGVPDAGDEAS